MLVVVSPSADRESLARCLRALLEHTPAAVPIAVAPSDAAAALLAEIDAPGREVRIEELPDACGHDGHVALVHPETEVTPGWLDGLLGAAGDDLTVATVSPLSNHGDLATVPGRNLPWTLLPHGRAPADAARAVGEASQRLRPPIPCALPHCTLLTRAALDLAGPFDDLDAFSARATGLGLRHLLADDVLVAHRGGAYDGWAPGDPALAAALEDARGDRWSALPRALAAASRAIARPTVTVDARCLDGGTSGTTVVTTELLKALTRAGVVPRVLVDGPAPALAAVPGAELLRASDVDETTPRTAIVHRPWQIDTPADLTLLDRLGERLVVSHHDLIGFRNPTVFASTQDWLDHRRVTAQALGLAAVTLFLSAHVRDDALAEDLLTAERALLAPPGLDHLTVPSEASVPGTAVGVPPQASGPGTAVGVPQPDASDGTAAGVPQPDGSGGTRPFLAIVGSHLRHKNVVFAMALTEALRERGWDGELVVAGREMPVGSSSGDEAAYLLARPQLAAHVRDLGAVPAATKAWLYANAAAIVVPSTVEGFGLVPFEAAAAGTLPLVAPIPSHAELLEPEAMLLVAWDAAASAERVLPALADPAPLVDAIRAAGERFTWDGHAAAVLAAYDQALALPAPPAARSAAKLAEAETAYWRQRDGLGAGYALVDPDDPLLSGPERELLVAVARGERTRPLLLRAAAALRRAARR